MTTVELRRTAHHDRSLRRSVTDSRRGAPGWLEQRQQTGTVDAMNGRFSPGDHLRVRRPRGYNHHGIYINDDRLIQFGSGITLTDKSRTGIDAVPLRDFENGGTVKIVRHGTPRWITGYDPPADEAWKIVERAEFLLKLQPRLPYHLIGHNCEHVANMCVAGTWIESYQVRTFFGTRALGSYAVLVWQGIRSRADLRVPPWVKWAAAAWAISGLASVLAYNRQIKKFWDEIGVDWQKHEQTLAKDPRNK
jgi:Lecithin retinol acyltransferase